MVFRFREVPRYLQFSVYLDIGSECEWVSHVSLIRTPVARTTDGRKTRKEKADSE
jgi:hypothetical protein